MKKLLFLVAILTTGCTYTTSKEPLENGLILIAEQDGCKLYYTMHENHMVYWTICDHEATTTSICVIP